MQASDFAADFAQKLDLKTRHVCWFLGAGASCSAGLPDTVHLKNQILERLGTSLNPGAAQIFATGTLEDGLTQIRRIAAVLGEGEELRGLTRVTAVEANQQICATISAIVGQPATDNSAFRDLSTLLNRSEYERSVEIFTTNYDTLIETSLEDEGVPYFDGFIGHIRPKFRSDLVEPAFVDARTALPSRFVRLWKLHGSVNWFLEDRQDAKIVVRTANAQEGDIAAIFPSDEKYEDSRRVPFIVLLDRFRRALDEADTVLIVSGYSFSDQHLNEILYDALQRNPRLAVEVFCYASPIPDLQARARALPGLSVYWPDGGVVGGRPVTWAGPEPVADLWDGQRFLMGDFARLTSFLARPERQLDVPQ